MLKIAWDKIESILTSRRFWAMCALLLVAWTGFAQHQITYYQALNDSLGAIAAYMISLGIDPGLGGKP